MDNFKEMLETRLTAAREVETTLREQLEAATAKREAYEKTLAIETGIPASNGNGASAGQGKQALLFKPKRGRRNYGVTKVSAVFDVIKAHPGLAPGEMYDYIPKETIAELGMKKENVYHGLQKLRSNERVQQDDQGRYYPKGNA